MLLKCLSPASTNPAWQQALKTPMNVIELSLILRLCKSKNISRDNVACPCMASPHIMAFQGVETESRLKNTRMDLLTLEDGGDGGASLEG
ncbi:hypothetical protein G4B88_015084 [Cannabis sativa]|uniref:Uncharacterized protein n=1 Tax=Cannabis sativa TaxID=3483 RepID=A0A7J6EJZ8_CANSA|nr:hypothetical protein G4B88_015084 [Cannabis sativa]